MNTALRTLAISMAGILFLIGLLASLSPNLPIPLAGAWWKEGAPFEELRWVQRSPQVLVDGEWFELEKINGSEVSEIIAFCKRSDGEGWRKRFSEDLVQVINRLRPLKLATTADLTLRNLETNEQVTRNAQPLSPDSRRAIWSDRYAWPWDWPANISANEIQYLGRSWSLVSIDDISAEKLGRGCTFDAYCIQEGNSPKPKIDFILRDPQTGEVREFKNVERDPSRTNAP